MKVRKNQYDSVFRMLFSDKTHLLSLYNAVSGKDFTNPDEIEITTLENAIFMNRKNDLSFILHAELWLFEHQTTVNPNMPLRDLLYVTDVLKKQIDECINNGILEEFLRAQKREVIALSIYEYNEERHMQYIREEGFEDGVAHGVDQERANTERERQRADKYQAEAEQLRALLQEHGITPTVH